MGEIRAITSMKEAAYREVEDAVSSKFESMLKATTQEWETKLNKNMADLLETIKLMIANPISGSGAQSHNRNAPMIATTPDLAFNNQDQGRNERLGNQSVYSGLTRLGKVDFPRFSGELFKEWLFKAE